MEPLSDLPIEIIMCQKCGKKPVHIKKRGLCSGCYQSGYQKGFEAVTVTSRVTVDRMENAGEVAFVQNFFGNRPFIHHPAKFSINRGSYAPDFYDVARNTFIEVIATKQAFHFNKEKYEAMRLEYPQLNFEVRHSSGKMLDVNSSGRYDWQ